MDFAAERIALACAFRWAARLDLHEHSRYATYITALQTGRELRIVSDAVAARTERQWRDYSDLSDHHFRELQAILDREDPSYRD